MFARLLVVLVPLWIASGLGAAVLALLLWSTVPPPLILVTAVTVIAAVVVHVVEQTRGAEQRRRLGSVIGQLLLWGLGPVASFAVVAAIYLVFGGNATVGFQGEPAVLFAVGCGGGILWVLPLLLLEKRFGTRSLTRSMLQMLRPVFLVVLPVFATFFVVNGGASVLLFLAFHGSQLALSHELIFGGVEAANGLIFVFAWSWIVRCWLRSSWFWVGVIVVMHALVAGYRTHRWEDDGLTSGPVITPAFDWPDVIAPLAGLGIFMLWRWTRRRASRPGSVDQVTALTHPS